jgi:hypothetical protein
MSLYHVSCAENHQSIMAYGLVPGKFIGFEETPSPFIYLAVKKPSTNINDMKFDTDKILDEYLLLRSADECSEFNLYKIDKSKLEKSNLLKSNDTREMLYAGTIRPESIELVKSYKSSRLNIQYRKLEASKRHWSD